MSSAIHLSLMIGPVIPVPVPAMMINALDSVTATSAASTASGFQLRFKVSSKSELNTIFLIAVGQNTSVGTPPLRVVLIVTLGGRPQPLFDGVVTNVEVQGGQNLVHQLLGLPGPSHVVVHVGDMVARLIPVGILADEAGYVAGAVFAFNGGVHGE